MNFIIGTTTELDILPKTTTVLSILDCDKQIGTLEVSVENDTCSVLYINIFDEHKRKGYATKAIEQLNERYTIVGDCLPSEDSIGFWTSVGAEFDEDITLEECIEQNSCIPFLLY